MSEDKREQIGARLAVIDAWRASGAELAAFATGQGLGAAQLRAWLGWEKRWRAALDGEAHPGFVRVRAPRGGAQKSLGGGGSIEIRLSRFDGGVQANVVLPLERLRDSAAWLREVLS